MWQGPPMQNLTPFQLLVKSQQQPDKIEMQELMKYPLMPVPSSVGTADGYLLKMDKSNGLAYLTKGVDNADVPLNERTFHIEDGNASFYTMKEVPGTFRQIAQKVFDQTTSGRSNVLLSTDMYKQKSIKAMERSNRGSGEKRLIKEKTQDGRRNGTTFCVMTAISSSLFMWFWKLEWQWL